MKLVQPCIQIAGIHDKEEAEILLRAGVPYLGFPLRLNVHREDLSEAEAAAIIAELPPATHAVLISYLNTAAALNELCRKLGCTWLQVHGAISPAELRLLRDLRPDLGIIKSLVVRGDNRAELFRLVDICSPYVNAFITDTHDPRTGADGATGQTHDWTVSRALARYAPCPLILAGGLTPYNVAEAIRLVRPYGVDVHTGVEAPDGRKDPALVRAFVHNARKALHEIQLHKGNTT